MWMIQRKHKVSTKQTNKQQSQQNKYIFTRHKSARLPFFKAQLRDISLFIQDGTNNSTDLVYVSHKLDEKNQLELEFKRIYFGLCFYFFVDGIYLLNGLRAMC